jgi:hypothetical protein
MEDNNKQPQEVVKDDEIKIVPAPKFIDTGLLVSIFRTINQNISGLNPEKDAAQIQRMGVESNTVSGMISIINTFNIMHSDGELDRICGYINSVLQQYDNIIGSTQDMDMSKKAKDCKEIFEAYLKIITSFKGLPQI